MAGQDQDDQLDEFVRRSLSIGESAVLPPLVVGLSMLISQVLLEEVLLKSGSIHIDAGLNERIAAYYRDQRSPAFLIEETPNGWVVAAKRTEGTE